VVVGYYTLDIRYWIVGIGHSIWDSITWILYIRSWIFGYWILDLGY